MHDGMWRRSRGWLLGALMAVQPAAAQQPPAAPPAAARAPAAAKTAAEVLAQADRGQNGFSSFIVNVRITNYVGDKVDKVTHYEVSIKGSNRSLVKFLEPEDRGKFLLTVDEFMWIYLRSASRPVRVTPLQRLSGNASNGDVAQTSLTENYQPVAMTEELLDGKSVYVMDLVARRKSATYQATRYWIAKDTLLPVKAEYKLGSGKPSKRAIFAEYQQVDGRQVLRRQEIYDLLRNEEKSVLEYSNYVRKELPDKLFNKNFRQEL
ncbi:MAG TPA: outer membrane lipoprotein-sorting protein [Myxococcus sp.]|nr:outer membrane lipoprotein-sorting protein [Myxococcus sp.]